MFLFLFCSRHAPYIIRDNAKTFTLLGLSYKDVTLLLYIFYVFDVVYVKSNNIRPYILIFWTESRGYAVKKAKESSSMTA